MSNILVDTSIWIHYFNNSDNKAKNIKTLLDDNLVCTNDIILTELIPFLKHEKQNDIIELLLSLRCYKIEIDWNKIQFYQYLNIKNGINAVGIPDLIILQNTLDNDLIIYSNDKHFQVMNSIHDFRRYKEKSGQQAGGADK